MMYINARKEKERHSDQGFAWVDGLKEFKLS